MNACHWFGVCCTVRQSGVIALAQQITKSNQGARLGNVVFEQMTAENWFKYFDADESGDVTLEEFLYGVTCVPELRIVGMVLNWRSTFDKCVCAAEIAVHPMQRESRLHATWLGVLMLRVCTTQV